MLVDLRQYTLHPGRRDELIDLFDRYFVEGQEATGMQLVGQFRDLDDPDRFVWLRGFPDYESRGKALSDFYGGPVWKAHREAANATMLDSDNALLLKPLLVREGYPEPGSIRPPIGAADVPPSFGAADVPPSIVAGAVYHRSSLSDGFTDFFRNDIEPALSEAGARPVAVFETYPAENNFPALPLRDDPVLVWLTTFAGPASYDAYRDRLATSPKWRDHLEPELTRLSATPPQHLRLTPTTRSALR
ncbi:NIPSNAP family protein [Kribbella deserti]|uniref:NIPSNAP family protein n=1 Tax=Kribbella deserti TaxID=1926257 RepID=A0ABV6QLK4_9ACTN